MMRKVAIVGGGYTGLNAAFLLKNSEIYLYENSRALGGITKDLEKKGEIFFSSCQYLSKDKWGEQEGEKPKTYKFDHTYSSYTDIFDEKTYSNNFAGPTLTNTNEDIRTERFKNNQESLAERISAYPTQICYGLEKWFKYIGIDIHKTHHSAAIGLQTSRIYIKNYKKSIQDYKKLDKTIDDLYGLPRELINLPKLEGYLPTNGFNDLFNWYTEKLRTTKPMKINLGESVQPIVKSSGLHLKHKDILMSYDKIIWTANPSPLIKEATGNKLESQKLNIEIIAGFLNEKINNPTYIQVFSLKTRVSRIFVYNINNKGCFTIEKFKDNQSIEEIRLIAGDILNSCGIPRINKVSIRKYSARFDAVTISDHAAIDWFAKNHDTGNLILPDLLAYGREDKIQPMSNILRSLDL